MSGTYFVIVFNLNLFLVFLWSDEHGLVEFQDDTNFGVPDRNLIDLCSRSISYMFNTLFF